MTMEAIADPTPTKTTGKTGPTLLCVDDEAGILKALKRVFRRQDYQVLTAESGAEGLEVLGRKRVDLVISDMRMPNMSGAEFLRQVAERHPDIVRILLTGYSDLDSTVAAVNDGKIFRYLSKPWNEDELREAVRTGLELRYLEAERRRLQLLTETQNEELKSLNASLEARVEQRTGQLRKAYQDTISVFSQVMEARENSAHGHGRRVAELARRIGLHLQLDDKEIRDLYIAALLHDIGKVALDDETLRKPINRLNEEERQEYERHVTLGPGLLASISLLEEPAHLIRHHHERFDGGGFPDGLVGQKIPLGSRIIAVADAYDGLRSGRLLGNQHTQQAALALLNSDAEGSYDPAIVEVLATILADQTAEQEGSHDLILTTEYLKPGMVLVKDVVSESSLLLLASGTVLDAKMINKLLSFERDLTERLEATVRA